MIGVQVGAPRRADRHRRRRPHDARPRHPRHRLRRQHHPPAPAVPRRPDELREVWRAISPLAGVRSNMTLKQCSKLRVLIAISLLAPRVQARCERGAPKSTAAPGAGSPAGRSSGRGARPDRRGRAEQGPAATPESTPPRRRGGGRRAHAEQRAGRAGPVTPRPRARPALPAPLHAKVRRLVRARRRRRHQRAAVRAQDGRRLIIPLPLAVYALQAQVDPVPSDHGIITFRLLAASVGALVGGYCVVLAGAALQMGGTWAWIWGAAGVYGVQSSETSSIFRCEACSHWLSWVEIKSEQPSG